MSPHTDGRRDMRREEAERLSEEREKQKDLNEIILLPTAALSC